jgi:GYF domain 2
MKFDWKNWNVGGKVIFVATCASTISMFMNWVDIGFASQSGLTQGAFLLLVFYIYPALRLFQNKSIQKGWGFACAILSVICAIIYINSKSIEFFGKTINAASTGAWLFLLASVALIVGIFKYRAPTSTEHPRVPGFTAPKTTSPNSPPSPPPTQENVYVFYSEQQQGPFSVAVLRRMRLENSIPQNALYWTEGLPEWRPLSEL